MAQLQEVGGWVREMGVNTRQQHKSHLDPGPSVAWGAQHQVGVTVALRLMCWVTLFSLDPYILIYKMKTSNDIITKISYSSMILWTILFKTRQFLKAFMEFGVKVGKGDPLTGAEV